MSGVDDKDSKGFEMPGFGAMNTMKEKFSIGLREIVLGIVILVLVIFFITFAGMYGSSKSESDSLQAQAIKGDKMDQTCFSKMCLETSAYTLFKMNTSADPCEDFYEYACGSFADFRPPDSQNPQHTIFTDMLKRNRDKIDTILESPIKRTTQWASEKKVKELFQSCMDDYTIEKVKGKPFYDQVIQQLGGWYVTSDWSASSFNLNNMLKMVQGDFWVDAMFALRVDIDFFQPTKTAVLIYPAGTSRHMYWFYYVYPQFSKMQMDYKRFMTRVANFMVRDSGVTLTPQTQQEKVAQFVSDAFEVEADLARLILSSPYNFNAWDDANQISLDDLTQQTGGLIDFTLQATYFFNTANIDGSKQSVVISLPYLKGLVNMINGIPIADRARKIHNYLMWRVMEYYVQDLSWEYVHANREVYVDRTGNAEFLGKANYCFYFVGRSMPEAVGSLFIADHFADQNKQKASDITQSTKDALVTLLAGTTWMDDATRTIAEEKIREASYKLGYPDFLTDHDKLDVMFKEVSVNVSDFFGNVIRFNQYHRVSWNKMLREGEDRNDWYFKTYDTNMAVLWYWNEVIVPAGLLQFPLYDYHMPHYYTFGGFGQFLGHFVLHLVDEWGKNWDKTGQYMGRNNEWWTNATMTAYDNVKNCVIDVYNVTQGPFTAPDGSTVRLPISSKSRATENIAVISGLKIAWDAYHLWESRKGVELTSPTGMDLTNDQLFFISFAQTNCYSRTPELDYRNGRSGRVRGDYKVNLAVSQLDEFSKAFKCSKKAKLNPPKKCTLY